MPVLASPVAPTHELHGVAFTALVSPSRGATEASVWPVEVPPGAPPAPHQVTREEVLVVLDGPASVRIGDERSQAGPGDAIVVPPDTTFELANDGDTALRALAYLPVGGQARLDGQTFTPPWAE